MNETASSSLMDTDLQKIEEVLHGTWRHECRVEEAGYCYMHFAPRHRCFTMVSIAIGGKRVLEEGTYEVVTPSLLRQDYRDPRKDKPLPPAQPFLLGRDVFVISAPWREFRCERVAPDEVPEWFRQPLAKRLGGRA